MEADDYDDDDDEEEDDDEENNIDTVAQITKTSHSNCVWGKVLMCLDL